MSPEHHVSVILGVPAKNKNISGISRHLSLRSLSFRPCTLPARSARTSQFVHSLPANRMSFPLVSYCRDALTSRCQYRTCTPLC